jgi:proline iminopeptidase
MLTREGYIEVPGGQVWYRSVGEIGVPALLVGGRHDECRPSHLEEMHRRIAGSQLAIIEDASHLCFAEQPQEFSSLVNSFLDRVESG